MKITATITPWGVYSVWRRHAKVYQNTWLVNFLPPITEPTVYLVAFGYGMMPLIGKITYAGRLVDYLHFIAPGMIAVGALSQSFFESTYGSYIRLSLQKTWQALLTGPLSFTEVFLGDWFWASTRGVIAAIVTGIVTVLWGLYSGWDLLLSLPLLCLGSLMFSAIGLLIAGTVRTIDQVGVPVYLFLVPMFVLGGTFFPRDNLPDWLKIVVSMLPLTALTDLMRWPLGLPEFWWLELLWMIVLTAICLVLAWRKIYPQLFR